MEVLLPGHGGRALQDGDADLLRDSRVHRGLENDHGPLLEVAAHGLGCGPDRAQVGLPRCVDGGGNGHDDKVRTADFLGIQCDFQKLSRLQVFARDFARGVELLFEGLDFPFVCIVTDRGQVMTEGHGQGKPHIAEPPLRQRFFCRVDDS